MTRGACLSFTKSVPESEILVPDACADSRESALLFKRLLARETQLTEETKNHLQDAVGIITY
jgi:hypothetical protein